MSFRILSAIVDMVIVCLVAYIAGFAIVTACLMYEIYQPQTKFTRALCKPTRKHRRFEEMFPVANAACWLAEKKTR